MKYGKRYLATILRKVFNTAIPRTIRLSEAPSFGKTIFEYDPRSMGAQAYLALTKEVIDRFHSRLKSLPFSAKE